MIHHSGHGSFFVFPALKHSGEQVGILALANGPLQPESPCLSFTFT